MAYVRGSRHDFDHWAAEGCTGWSYKDVLPYFLKMEDSQIPSHYDSRVYIFIALFKTTNKSSNYLQNSFRTFPIHSLFNDESKEHF